MSRSNRVKVATYLVTGAWSLVILIAGVKIPGVATKVLGSSTDRDRGVVRDLR